MKMDFPELVKKAITSACKSGRKLSWKIQENDRGTLVQLVWKPELFLAGNSSKNSEVSSNWNLAGRNSPRTAQKSKKQHRPPSRFRRNVRHSASFIEKKQSAQETCTQEIRKDTKCETIISKPVELTAAYEVESTMLNLNQLSMPRRPRMIRAGRLTSSLQQHLSPSPTKLWIPL